MKITTFALHDLLLRNPSHLPVGPLCPFFSCLLKTVEGAILLMTFKFGVLLTTVQTLHDLSRFSGIGCPAGTATESMGQCLGLEHRPAGSAGFWWSVLEVQPQPCPLQFGLIRTLCRAGHCSRNPKELSAADHTILGRILLLTPPISPSDTADLAAGLGLPICLEHGLADDAGLRRDRPILQLLLLIFMNLTAGLPTGELMCPDGDEHQLADSAYFWRIPFLLSQLSSPFDLHPTPRKRSYAVVLHLHL